MKEFICNLIQIMGTFFHPKHEKQAQVEKANGNTRKLQRFLLERFDFRYNQLTGVTEYRPKGVTDTPFSPIDERNMNRMIVDTRLRGTSAGNGCVIFRMNIKKSYFSLDYPIIVSIF